MQIALNDSMTNIVSGLGTDRDKMSFSQFTSVMLTQPQIDAMYNSSWLAGTMIDAAPNDMTRAWRSWKAVNSAQISKLEAEEKRLEVQSKVNRALKLGQLYGGGAIIMGISGQDPAKPVDLTKVTTGSLMYLHVVSRYTLGTTGIDRDLMSPNYGGPAMFTLQNEHGREVQIHPSRVIRFLGRAPLETENSIDGWGHSVLTRCYTPIQQVETIAANAASLTFEAKLDVIQIPQLNERSRDPLFVANLLARFTLANRAKSIQNMLLLDEREKWEQKTAQFAGLVDLISKHLEMAAGALSMPVSRALGRAPSGLNANVDSETRQWYDTVDGWRTLEVDPGMDRLNEVLIRSALGKRPSKVWSEWNPMWQLTPQEAAEIGAKQAATDTAYASMGIASPEAMRKSITSLLVDRGMYPDLENQLNDDETLKRVASPLIVKPVSGSNPGTKPNSN